MSTLLGPTFKTYLLRHRKSGRYWSELGDRYNRYLIPGLGGETRILATITKADLRALIDAKEDEGHPVAARTVYEALSPFFKWCLGRDLILRNPMETLPPPRIPQARDRILTEGELRKVWYASKKMALWGPFFNLLMLTCQRRNEVAGIQYHEVENGLWTIPGTRTKNGKTHEIHLSEQAQAIINSRPEFIGRNVSGFSKAKLVLDKLSGVENWRIHDLRRTGATTLQKLGVLPDHIELILNHTPKGIRAVYQRFQYAEERKLALGLLGLYMESL